MDEETLVKKVDGVEVKYYKNPIRTMRLEVQNLQLHTCATVYHLEGKAAELPDPHRQLRGTASLGRSKISVIGAPNTMTRVLDITFRVMTDTERANTAESQAKHGQTARYTGVSVGYVHSDWEIGNGDKWFVECYVAEATFTALANAVESGTLKKANIGLHLEDIYTDDNWAPPSASPAWFLEPDRIGAEMARGDIINFDIAMNSVSLVPPPKTEPEPEENELSVRPAEPVVSPETVALATLAANVEKLRGTVKWVGGFVAVFLFMLVMKGA